MLNFFIILPLFIFIILFFLPTYTSNQVVVAVTVREMNDSRLIFVFFPLIFAAFWALFNTIFVLKNNFRSKSL
jgi:hypothetical protein